MDEQIEKLMKSHDWSYEYADDLYHWSKGEKEKQEIIKLILKKPLNNMQDYLNLVPKEFKTAWVEDLEREIAYETKKGK